MVQLKVQCIGFGSLPHVECREATLKHRKNVKGPVESKCLECLFGPLEKHGRLHDRLPL